MAKISALDPIDEPTGEEMVVVLADGEARRVALAPLAGAALAPHVAAANDEFDVKLAEAAGSATTAADAAARLTPFNTAPATNHVLYRVKNSIRLRKYVGVVAVNWPTGLCIREAARDLSGGTQHRYRLRVGSYNGAYTEDVLAESPAAVNLNAAGKVGKLPVDLYFRAGHPDVVAGLIPSGTWAGSLPYDFGAGEVHGNYATLKYDYALGGLDPLRVLPDTTALADAVNAVKADAAGRVTSDAFEIDIADPYLKSVVRKIELFCTKRGHIYRVSFFKTTAAEFMLIVRDTTEDKIAAVAKAAAPNYATIPELLFFDPRNVGGNIGGEITTATGIYGKLHIDRSKIVASGATWSYTQDQAAIKVANCMTRDEVVSRFWNDRTWQEIITVEPEEVVPGDLRAKFEALYAEGAYANQTDLWVRWCHRAAPNHRILLWLKPGTHKATNLYGCHNVDIGGPGADKVTVECENSALVRPNLQLHMSHKIFGFRCVGNAVAPVPFITTAPHNHKAQYGIHRDKNNEFEITDSVGDVNFWCGFDMQDVEMVGDQQHNFALFGAGGSSGEHSRIRNCRFVTLNATRTAPLAAMHTCSGSKAAVTFEFDNVYCDAPPGVAGVAVQSVGTNAPKSRLVIRSCPTLKLVSHSAHGIADSYHFYDLARDRCEWVGIGDYQGAFLSEDDSALVLRTTPGISVAGDAAPILFGTVDAGGKGSKSVKEADASNAALGKRLGDCRTINRTLTIGAQTIVFDQLYTNQSNATIVATINAVITANPVSVVNVGKETQLGFSILARLLNNSGATIAATAMCKTVGRSATKAIDGDVVDAVAVRDVATGAEGDFIIGRKLDPRLFGLATTANGALYVANGAPTLTPQLSGHEIGRARGGQVELRDG
ncbi:hypothetical protein [Sphingomonas sp. LT1P40]|uniref:hypothetical protein n=1 Tax=Alteristakelama amylovorans TaxID=3096166 RepID=UPI002FCB84A0